MSARLPILGRVLITMLLFAWPFGGLLYIPIAGYSLTTLLMLALIAVCMLHMAATRTARIPFELAWPVPILIIAAWIARGQGNAWNLTLGLLSYLAVVHFVESGNTSASLLRLTATAGALLAVTCLAAQALGVLPMLFTQTPFDAVPAISFLAPDALAPEVSALFVTTFTISLIALWHGCRTAGRMPWLTLIVLGAFLLEALAFNVPRVVMAFANDYYELPNRNPLQWIALALCAWLFARAGAKAVVRLREQGASGHSAVLLAGAAFLCFAVLPTGESVGPFLVLGVLAMGGRAGQDTARPTTREALSAIPVATLALLNLIHVSPENTTDPRNYEASLRRAVQSGHLERAWEHMDALDSQGLQERRVCFWRARIALEYHRPYLASREFAGALHRSQVRQLLPPPTEDEVSAFLVRLRDYCSSMPNPERVLAYERALIAAGRLEDSIALLSRKAKTMPEETPIAEADVLYSALARYVNLGIDERSLLRAISPGQCQALLRACGVNFRAGVLPAGKGPILCSVEFWVKDIVSEIGDGWGMSYVKDEKTPDYSAPPFAARWEVGSDAPPILCTLIATPDP
ncbi:MAG: hypothetical protein IT365_27460, partial [Candidatus Hydrogenedentes bacterium]|nr:hypothetical protein [Candidatus Hydrogenedentota bacterium]